MDRQQRKKIKQDEFVEGTLRAYDWLERNIKPVGIGAGVFVVLVLAGWAGTGLMKSRANHSADLLARGLAALTAPVVTGDGTANPAAEYQPSFATAEERQRAAVERLSNAASGSGAAAKIALYLKGIAQIQAGDPQAAVPTLRDAVSSLAGDKTLAPLSRAALAEALSGAGQHDDAIAEWKRLAEKDSGYPRDLALDGEARALERSGKTDEALSLFRELVDAYPDSPVQGAAREAVDRLEG